MWGLTDRSRTAQHVSERLAIWKVVTDLFDFEWGFDDGHILLNVSLQRWNVNWLANGACHV